MKKPRAFFLILRCLFLFHRISRSAACRGCSRSPAAGGCSTTRSAGVPFAWRGDRAGVWATAPVAGALLALLVATTFGFPSALALLVCLAGAAGYTAAIAFAEARFERLILLDLTALDLRFERILDTRDSLAAPRSSRRDAASAELTPHEGVN